MVTVERGGQGPAVFFARVVNVAAMPWWPDPGGGSCVMQRDFVGGWQTKLHHKDAEANFSVMFNRPGDHTWCEILQSRGAELSPFLRLSARPGQTPSGD